MSILSIRGLGKIEVSRDYAEQVMLWKYGDRDGNNKMPGGTPLNIDGKGVCSLSAVDGILITPDEKINLKFQKHAKEAVDKKQQIIEKLKNSSTEEKIKRMISFSYMLYKARQNEGVFDYYNYRTENDLKEIREVFRKYFTENPQEYHCPNELYVGLIPVSKPKKTGTGSFKSFAELI